MGFFKPADDDTEADGTAGDDDAAGEPRGDDGALASSSEGEGSDALQDLGVDVDAGLGGDGGSAPGL